MPRGRFGLISGLRRVLALREMGVAEVLAFVRKPESPATSYVAMVEENEIRAGLSFYERANIAVQAVGAGVYPNVQTAVKGLFAHVAPAKRSKILRFVVLRDALGRRLSFPTAIPEKLGLALASAIEADAAAATRITDALRKTPPADAAAERRVLERALKARRHRPMFMVDLAVPRDIEPEVGQLSDIYLYTVDDLSEVVQTAGEKRQAAVQQAEAIVDAGVQSFAHWLDQRAAVPLIQALNRQADDWRSVEMARARKLLARGADVDQVLEALSRGLTQKMLHGALAELHATDGTQREELAHTVSRLFLRQSSRNPEGNGR